MDNGLGDDIQFLASLPWMTSFSTGCDSSGAPWKHYSVVRAGPSFTVDCTPSASGNANAEVRYTASATPIDIVFTGGKSTIQPNNFIVGQPVNSTISPVTSVNAYSWSASGATPFKDYDSTKATNQLTLFSGPETGNSFSPYFAGSGTGTVFCGVTIAVPAGSKPTAGFVSGTIHRDAFLETPTIADQSSRIGTVTGLNSPIDRIGLAGIDVIGGLRYSPTIGMWFQVSVKDPSGYDGTGKFTWCQLVSLGTSRSNNGTIQQKAVRAVVNNSNIFATDGLLDAFNEGRAADGGPNSINDSPSYQLLTGMSLYSCADSFKLYVMYTPPGSASKAVPLGYYPWDWSGLATYDNSQQLWSIVPHTPHILDWVSPTTHPQWSYQVANSDWYSH